MELIQKLTKWYVRYRQLVAIFIVLSISLHLLFSQANITDTALIIQSIILVLVAVEQLMFLIVLEFN